MQVFVNSTAQASAQSISQVALQYSSAKLFGRAVSEAVTMYVGAPTLSLARLQECSLWESLGGCVKKPLPALMLDPSDLGVSYWSGFNGFIVTIGWHLVRRLARR